MITWSTHVWIYLWLGGMAGGAYFASFLAERFAGEVDGKLTRLATVLGIPLAIAGVVLLVLDLGRPLRFWHLLVRFNILSPMSMGTWILLVWVGISVILAILWYSEHRFNEQTARKVGRVTGFLTAVNLIFAVLLMTYTGVLLAVSNQPPWEGAGLLPCLFVVSAISTGTAMIIIAALLVDIIIRRGFGVEKLPVGLFFHSGEGIILLREVAKLAKADAIVIVVELAVLIGYAVWLGTSAVPGTGELLKLIATGSLAVPFWAGAVPLAMLLPLGLEIIAWGKGITTKSIWHLLITSSACIVLGGLILRAVIVIGGQM